MALSENLPRSDEELLEIAKSVSERDFGRPFLHRCRFNPRLRTSGGRYLLKTHDVEINPRYVELYGWTGLEDTLRHELCHYHLHLQGLGHRHGDRDFREWLARVGGSRYARPTGLMRPLPVRYHYSCESCGIVYPRKRMIDVGVYVCGRCRGRLQLSHKN